MIRRIIFAILLLCMLLPLSALELRDGKLKLIVDERSGRFSLYHQVSANQWLALLYDEENKTTYPTLLLDQKTYKLGESSEFRTVVTSTTTAIRIEYRASFCTVVQSLNLVKSSTSSVSNGLRIDFEITNTGQADVAIGLRYLFDTWLGEQAGRHFYDMFGSVVNNESKLSETSSYLISSADSKTGLIIETDTVESPSSIILANWKRLNDSPWNFDILNTRNFTLLPYSINDSAVALYYDSKTLRRGASRNFSIVLGAAYSGTFLTASSVASSETVPIMTQLLDAEKVVQLDLETDLSAAKEILEELNDLLKAAEAIDSTAIDQLESVLDKLEQRQGSY
ncbi:MAG: hypothetical protein KKI09_00085 [Spirochaetes bacterium]|nr:hypothetical protein [Spirochaetota bacterium]MBU0953795.1 hypothetical protein [Spirochaetota bacterium]